MIDELINKFADYCACDEYHYGVIDGLPGNHDPKDGHMDFDEEKLKTAIYEIGLECIGADEKPSWDITPESAYKISTKDDELWSQKLKPKKTIVHSESEKARNDLRAAQRKAWAKACGVAEK